MGLRPPKVMAPVQSLEAPPSPLSSRPKRSAVERSAVQRLFPGYVFRQRVADFLVRAAGNEHSVGKESLVQRVEATDLDRKSGGA